MKDLKFKIFMILIALIAVFIFLRDFIPDGSASFLTFFEMLVLIVIQQYLIKKHNEKKRTV